MQRIERILTFEGPLSSRSLKKNAAEGEDVRAVIELSHFTLSLFGRHVSGCPHDHARHGGLGQNSGGGCTGRGPCRARDSLRLDQVSQSEIQNLRVVIARVADVVRL